MRQIVPQVALVPTDANKDKRSRLTRFAAWLDAHNRPWYQPDLAIYRDTLFDDGLSALSVSAHLSSVRSRYKELLRLDSTRDALYELANAALTRLDTSTSPAQRKAFVDEIVKRIENAIDPNSAPVTVKVSQDRADSEQLRLTRMQSSALLAAPGVSTLKGLRNTAILAVFLCTGVREAELAALAVDDLRQRLGGELALHVREGKGCKERLVPWGGLAFGLAIVGKWLQAAGIEESHVFRAINKGGRLYGSGMSTRAIQQTIGRYRVVVDGRAVRPRPHDLRRTYARRLYEAGVDVVAIQQNLGHSDLKTTLSYIGELDADRRKPPTVYDFDLTVLEAVAVQVRI